MVAQLGLGKFYGSSLPRPRIYTDVKYNHERVDPPVSVVDPLLSWANEAHWTMGGLCTKRLRLQGRIEGNISKLRAQNEKLTNNNNNKKFEEKSRERDVDVDLADDDDDDEPTRSASPPPAPMAVNRKRRFMALIEEEEEEVRVWEKKKKPARKLINEFNSVATTPTRRSPRSAAAAGNRRAEPLKSIGGSFVNKMKKASENLMRHRNGNADMPIEQEAAAAAARSNRTRVSPRLLNKKM